MKTNQYAIYYSSVNFALCVYSVYIMLYLSESGYTPFEIGIFTALSGLMGIVAQLVWGVVADLVSAPKLLFLLMLLLILVSLSINLVPNQLRIYLILVVIFLQSPLPLLSETWALTYNRTIAERFGFIRGLGSLGWGLSSVLSGSLIGWLGFEAMFPLYALLFITPMLMMFWIMRRSLKREPQSVQQPSGEEQDRVVEVGRSQLFMAFRGQFDSSFYAVILFLTFAGLLQSVFGFMPLFIQEMGEGTAFLGIYTLIMTISEIPMFIYSDRIFNRFSLNSIIRFVLIAYAVRFLAHWISDSTAVVLGLSLLQAITYPLLFIMGKRLILLTVNGENHNTAFGLLASVQSVFGIGFSVLSGWIMERFQVRSLFMLGLLLCIISYWMYRRLISERWRNTKSAS